MSNATESMPHVTAAGLGVLDNTRWFLNQLIEPLTDEQFMTRPCPNGNHAMWCVGHIAATEDFFLTAVAGQPTGLPDGWMELFKGGSTPSDNADDYPSRNELLRVLSERRDAVKAWLSSLSEQELRRPLDGGLEKFAPTIAHLPGALVMHESVHAGQISAARRAMGMPPTF